MSLTLINQSICLHFINLCQSIIQSPWSFTALFIRLGELTVPDIDPSVCPGGWS